MEPDLIRISELADFQFCPKSVYFHHVYSKYEKSLYQGKEQLVWTLHHETVDHRKYSTKKRWLQWMDVYSRKYWLIGKIDLYDTESRTLVERKYHIKRLYLGNLYQIYAQYFSLVEMWYPVERIKFHSIRDNKNYPVDPPDVFEETKFSTHLERLKAFEVGGFFIQNPKKCHRCVYRELCDTGIGIS